MKRKEEGRREGSVKKRDEEIKRKEPCPMRQ